MRGISVPLAGGRAALEVGSIWQQSDSTSVSMWRTYALVCVMFQRENSLRGLVLLNEF